jgi:hypothetical protein
MSGVIKGGNRMRLSAFSGSVDSGERDANTGLLLNNLFGGRSYGNLDSSVRTLAKGVPSQEPAGTYKTFSTRPQSDNIILETHSVESNDIASPYVIMP